MMLRSHRIYKSLSLHNLSSIFHLPSPFKKRDLGKRGEDIAITFLKKQKYRILQRNFRTHLGEIDIIAQDGDTVVFVEVKTRERDTFGEPFESVNYHKKRRLIKVASIYLKRFRDIPPCRFDVISITFRDNIPHLHLIKDAFEADTG